MREKVQAVNNSMQYLNTLNFGRVYTLPLFSASSKGRICAAVSATAVYVEPLLSCQPGAKAA